MTHDQNLLLFCTFDEINEITVRKEKQNYCTDEQLLKKINIDFWLKKWQKKESLMLKVTSQLYSFQFYNFLKSYTHGCRCVVRGAGGCWF